MFPAERLPRQEAPVHPDQQLRVGEHLLRDTAQVPPDSHHALRAAHQVEVPGGNQPVQRGHTSRHPLLHPVSNQLHSVYTSIYINPPPSCPSWVNEDGENFVVKSICKGEVQVIEFWHSLLQC